MGTGYTTNIPFEPGARDADYLDAIDAQVIPALPGAIVGVPLGIGLFAAASGAGHVVVPPAWWLAGIVLATLVVVAGLTSIPARIGTRSPVAAVLGQEA